MIGITKMFGLGSAIAATTIGFNLVSVPAQAASLGEMTMGGFGQLTLEDDTDPKSASSFDFTLAKVVGDGIFSGLDSVTVKTLSFDSQGSFQGVNQFLRFNDSDIFFNLKAGQADHYQPLSQNVMSSSFTGNFFSGKNQFLGSGGISINSSRKAGQGIQGYNLSMNVEAVPEPMTILGSAAALGFGALFKKRFPQG